MTAAFEELVDHYKLTCPSVPTQYEGVTADGRSFYFRYRFGKASLGFGSTIDEAAEDSFGRELRHGDDLDGSLAEQEFCDLYVRLSEEWRP